MLFVPMSIAANVVLGTALWFTAAPAVSVNVGDP